MISLILYILCDMLFVADHFTIALTHNFLFFANASSVFWGKKDSNNTSIVGNKDDG